jgi:hypothetical protein
MVSRLGVFDVQQTADSHMFARRMAICVVVSLVLIVLSLTFATMSDGSFCRAAIRPTYLRNLAAENLSMLNGTTWGDSLE